MLELTTSAETSFLLSEFHMLTEGDGAAADGGLVSHLKGKHYIYCDMEFQRISTENSVLCENVLKKLIKTLTKMDKM